MCGESPGRRVVLLVPTSKIQTKGNRQSKAPRPRTNYLKKLLVYQGTLIWSSLPKSMRILTWMYSKELARVISLTLHFKQSASFAIAVTCSHVFIFIFFCTVFYMFTCIYVCIYVHINGHVYLHFFYFLYCVLHVYMYVYMAMEEQPSG